MYIYLWVSKESNRHWKIPGFPFSSGLKNTELKLWSIMIVGILLAKTATDKIINIDIIIIDQQYQDGLLINILFELIFMEILTFLPKIANISKTTIDQMVPFPIHYHIFTLISSRNGNNLIHDQEGNTLNAANTDKCRT